MKRKIAAFLMALVMAASGNGMPALAAPDTNELQQSRAADEIQLPTANVLDVDFENEDGTDKSEMANEFRSVWKNGTGRLTFEDNTELNRKVANFYDYAYVYPFNQEKYSKITNAVTVECLFKYNEFWWGEREIFSNQQGGGIGLGVDNNGKLTFYAHVGGSYREPKAELKAGEWVHAIGVVDGTSVRLYVNGKLTDTVNAQGTIKYPENTSAQNFVIGGDSDGSGGAENYANVSVSFARIYDHALTEQEVSLLVKKAFEGTDKKINAGLVTADTAPAGGIMNVNLHLGCKIAENVDRVSYTLAYDPQKVTYCQARELMSGVTLDDSTDGMLKVDFSGSIPSGDFREYAKTKIGELDFKAADVENTAETVLEIRDFHAYLGDEEVTSRINSQIDPKTITIYGKDTLDLNGDGVVGVGDVALAEDGEVREAIAQKAAIYPYKHAVILTIDGGGNVWNPEEIYYAASASDIPQKTRNAQIMEKRTNTYAMELFNREFATSFTAQAVDPSISAQNYTSILHGVPWGGSERGVSGDK
ncbi:MAG: LamG domain-containing protein [Hominisplanchenecus sp.]